MAQLQTKLSELMAEKKIRPIDIEKSTGLNRNTVYSIVSGSSKSPSVHNLQLIAKALNVSLESILIGGGDFKLDSLSSEQMIVFAKATDATIKIMVEKDLNVSLDKLISLIKEVYQYSIKIDPPTIDERFIHWVIDKYRI